MRPGSSHPSLHRRAVLAATLVAALALTACGGGDGGVEADPRDALQSAVAEFEDYAGYEVELSLDGEESVLTSGDDALSEESAALLLDSSVTARGVAGEEPDGSDSSGEFLVDVGGEQLGQFRALGGSEFFFQIDLDGIFELIDDPDAEAGFEEFTGFAGQMGLGELVGAVEAGDWIALSGFEQMQSMAEGMMGGAAEQPSDEDIEAARGELADALDGFLEDDVEVSYVGDEEAGQRVRATAEGPQLRALVEDAFATFADLSPVGSQMGMAPEDLAAEVAGDIPDDVSISVDAWIQDGRISQVGFDVLEAARQAGGEDVPEGEMLVVMAIAEFDGSIEAPEDATEVDLFEVFGTFMGGAMGPGMGGMGDQGSMEGFDEGSGGGAASAGSETLDAPEDVEVEVEEAP